MQADRTVRADEKLAVIEAMKMKNILATAQDAVAYEVLARKGESLFTDHAFCVMSDRTYILPPAAINC